MSAHQETLHLLLLTETLNTAENLVSMLRNSGVATRAHSITSVEDFIECLQGKTWDMVIAQPEARGIHSRELIQQIQKLHKDLPLLLLSQDDIDPISFETAIKYGAVTLMPQEESNIMLFLIQREIQHLRNRREKRTLEVKLREVEKRYQGMLASSRDAIAYIHDGMHIHANQAYLDLFGYESVAELEGMPIIDMVNADEQKAFKAFLKHFEQDQNHQLDIEGVTIQGDTFPMEMVFSPTTYSEEQCTQVLIRQQPGNAELENQLSDLRNRDQLTGIYNKTYFTERLEKIIEQAVLKRSTGAVLYINIDQFGEIKSRYGIRHADTIICAVAEALQTNCTEQNSLSRIGEDIFGLLHTHTDVEQVLKQSEIQRGTIEHLLIEVGDRTATVTCSIGVALVTETSTNPNDLLQQAHIASGKVRQQEHHSQGNGVCLYEEDNSKPKIAENIEKLLSKTLASNSFRIMFQPVINLRGDETEHYEVLLRLPEGNNDTASGDFINDPDIPDSLKRKIDRWVILRTTKLLSEHRAKGHNTRLFINLSAASLVDDKLPAWLVAALKAAQLPRDAVVFQFTEESAINALKQCQTFTQALVKQKIPAALSHFGCSLDPLQSLKHLQVQYVKIDGSFTHELDENANSAKSLQEMLEQLHEAEKLTMVPKVENANAVSTLWQMGVHFIQGYYVQTPQDSMDFNFSDE